MATSFTDWNPNELAHYGIPGMKWGVRRYQEKDGSLTPAGLLRYGANGRGASARKMQRDFNRLDKGFANVAADQRYYGNRVNKYANKSTNRAAKKNLVTLDQMNSDRKMKKYAKKMQKAANEHKAATKRMEEIQSLQWRIIGKAAEKGYTVNSKAVTRYGESTRARKAARAVLYTMGGGAIGGAIYGGIRGYNRTVVRGQKVKIRKTKKGQTPSTRIVSYANHG